MISHGADATPVAEWVARDPVLSRIRWPDTPLRVCLVGGVVRDALLGVPHGPDIDIVVEGDAIAVATLVGRDLGGRVITHGRFGTARIELPHGRHVDLVSARRETYAQPGALPDVSPGTLSDDLGRRDFTVNAIAFVLAGDGEGGMCDPYDGRSDLTDERIRIIRDGAFREDPSRVVRALRYAARLGFRMDARTEERARAAAPDVDLQATRVADEAARLLGEESAPSALAMGSALGLRWPDPDPHRDQRLAALAGALGQPGAPAPAAWALRLGLGVDPGQAATAAMPHWARGVAAEVRSGLDLAGAISQASRPSEVDALLRALPEAQQIGVLIGGADAVTRWWAEWRDLVPDVTGSDLVGAGVAPGPVIGRALSAVRAALIDGEVSGRGEQMAVALAVAGRFR